MRSSGRAQRRVGFLQSRYVSAYLPVICYVAEYSQFRSVNDAFEPVCAHVTKDDCAKARAAQSPPQHGICNCVHFRPLIRPHTDPTLGHCSYLNTCYSEPTYAQSPSIPPLPSAQNQINSQWPKPQLPSGLGAGGRGKEKAPCRYLHYEVDFDPGDAGNEVKKEDRLVRKAYRLPIGLGPTGTIGEMVLAFFSVTSGLFISALI
jgi:mRNA (2'-O-methyladenosine-N6-)-methyltransferase